MFWTWSMLVGGCLVAAAGMVSASKRSVPSTTRNGGWAFVILGGSSIPRALPFLYSSLRPYVALLEITAAALTVAGAVLMIRNIMAVRTQQRLRHEGAGVPGAEHSNRPNR